MCIHAVGIEGHNLDGGRGYLKRKFEILAIDRHFLVNQTVLDLISGDTF